MTDTANGSNATSDEELLRRTGPDWSDVTQCGVFDRKGKRATDIVGGGVAITPGGQKLQEKADKALKILVCEECGEYYDYDDEWQTCPKCETELIEVNPA